MSLGTIWMIIAIIYIIGIFVTYKFFVSKWDRTMFDKIWFSCVWIVLIPLYAIYLVNKKLK